MLPLRHWTREDMSFLAAAGRPVVLATLDVRFAEAATAFAVDSAVEAAQPLIVVNAAQIALTPAALVGYGYLEREDLQRELRKPAELAQSLAVRVERLRVCSPHPTDALIEIVAERNPSLLVFGPDRSALKPRTYRRAAQKILAHVSCLVWVDEYC